MSNASSHTFYPYLGVKVEFEGKVEPREVDQVRIYPGTNTIRLKLEGTRYKKEEIVSWTLGIDQYGVLWRSAHNPVWQDTVELHEEFDICEQWMIDVIPNETYCIDNDPQNMPLTEPQFNILQKILLKVLQKPAPYSQLWSQVREEMISSRQEDFGPIIPQNLNDAVDSSDRRFITRLPCWQHQYTNLQLKADPNKEWATQSLVDKGLTLGGRAHIDVYWRALDRQPGGNNDIHTACYTFDCATQTVSTRLAQNWDGTLERTECTPHQLSERISGKDPTEPFASFLRALRSLGPGDSECTIPDTVSLDSDAYDTEWSSHEILVSLPRPWSPSAHLLYFPKKIHQSTRQFLLGNQRRAFLSPIVHKILEFAAPQIYVPVLRLHQRCVLGPQWRSWIRLEQGPEIPPSNTQQTVLNAARDLIRMGRVNTFSDAGDGAPPCEAQKDIPARPTRALDEGDMNNCTMHPYYFDFPAANVATTQQGTSAQWKQPQRKRPS